MKKELISESRLREIISEEAARFKKKLTLEAEKKKILNRLQEMYMEEEVLDEVEEVMPTQSDVQKLLATLPYTPEQIAQTIQQDSEVLDAIKNPQAEAKKAEQLAADLLKQYPLNEEEAGQTIAENPKEFKVRLGKILKGLGIGAAAGAVILGAVSIGIASGGIAGGFALATPMAYAAAVSFGLGTISAIAGAKEVKKGYEELANMVVKNDKTFLNLLDKYKQTQDAKVKGSIILQINKHLTKVAEDNKITGLAGNQQLGFIDTVKDKAGIPRKN
jgi:hypothetical protein